MLLAPVGRYRICAGFCGDVLLVDGTSDVSACTGGERKAAGWAWLYFLDAGNGCGGSLDTEGWKGTGVDGDRSQSEGVLHAGIKEVGTLGGTPVTSPWKHTVQQYSGACEVAGIVGREL